MRSCQTVFFRTCLYGIGGKGTHAEVILEVEEEVLVFQPNHPGILGPGRRGLKVKPHENTVYETQTQT